MFGWWKEKPTILIVQREVALLTAPGIHMSRRHHGSMGYQALVDPRIEITSGPGITWPMSRVIFADGSATGWNIHGPDRTSSRRVMARWCTAIAIETAAPDQHGRVHYAQLKIG